MLLTVRPCKYARPKQRIWATCGFSSGLLRRIWLGLRVGKIDGASERGLQFFGAQELSLALGQHGSLINDGVGPKVHGVLPRDVEQLGGAIGFPSRFCCMGMVICPGPAIHR